MYKSNIMNATTKIFNFFCLIPIGMGISYQNTAISMKNQIKR